MRSSVLLKICVSLFAVHASACTPLTAYRGTLDPCLRASESACADRPIQDVAVEDGAGYRIGYIEFDDQGHLFDRRQLNAVVDPLTAEASSTDFLIVVFAHGWKHNAKGHPEDQNIGTFKEVLSQLAKTEREVANFAATPPRKVVGIYLGWRGSSVSLPVLEELTFWDRKSTAHQVGEIGVAEVLLRLEGIKDLRRAILSSQKGSAASEKSECDQSRDEERSRLVVVGHSFGGAIVYSALAHILEERFLNSVCGPLQMGRVRGFGDLTVLVNPAFEAMKFSTLSDMAYERKFYPKAQLPVLAILTSEADVATSKFFALGRWFSTLFEKERSYTRHRGDGAFQTISEKLANRQAVGHFAPYRTHELRPIRKLESRSKAAPPAELMTSAAQLLQGWRDDDGSHGNLLFGPLRLDREPSAAPRSPYLVAKVSKDLIGGHNDLSNPLMLDFVKGLIVLKSQPAGSIQAYSQLLQAQ